MDRVLRKGVGVPADHEATQAEVAGQEVEVTPAVDVRPEVEQVEEAGRVVEDGVEVLRMNTYATRLSQCPVVSEYMAPG